jgi:two-component system sensor histidine kinase UhpB
VLGAFSFCALEASLICGLLVQRKQRKSAQALLQESHARIEDLAGRLLTEQETERARIARDLHDDVAQSLAALSLKIRILMDEWREVGVSEIGNSLKAIESLAETIGNDVRALSHSLHPEVLRNLGLAEAAGSLCQEFQKKSGLAVTCHVGGGLDSIRPEIAVCLYRIAQETLRNVCKHSGADRATVMIERKDGVLNLTVADNGQGFDRAALDENEQGLGLISIEERARLVNGTVELCTMPGAGVVVQVRVPVAE